MAEKNTAFQEIKYDGRFDAFYDIMGTYYRWDFVEEYKRDGFNKIIIYGITSAELIEMLKECNLDFKDLINVEKTTIKITKEKYKKN